MGWRRIVNGYMTPVHLPATVGPFNVVLVTDQTKVTRAVDEAYNIYGMVITVDAPPIIMGTM